MFQIGQTVRVKKFGIASGKETKHAGQIFKIHKIMNGDKTNVFGPLYYLDGAQEFGYYAGSLDAYNEGVYPMLKTIGSDMKSFIAEHKSAIYWIAVMFLLDHVLFQGAFRERLHGLMNKLLGKVESQIDGKTVSLVPPEAKP